MRTDSAMDLDLYSPSEKFKVNVSEYLIELRHAYRTSLLRGDDESVYTTNVTARIVEHAAEVHESACLLAAVRPSKEQPASRAAEASAAKHYLLGVQNRLSHALERRDVDMLERISKAATSTINNLANPDDAFGGIYELEDATKEKAQDADKSGSNFRGIDFNSLSGQSKAVLVLYAVMLLGALVAVIFITRSFIVGLIRPNSFLRVVPHNALPMPVVTLCLSRPGIPHSRFRVWRFKDGTGRLHRGVEPNDNYVPLQINLMDSPMERFWENPNKENCTNKVGDFYPFDTTKLNALANGSTETLCKPCYRFGHKRTVVSRSTDFKNSSLISLFTDHYALECFQRPGGLTYQSRDYLQDVVYRIVQSPDEPLAKFDILNRADGGNMRELMTDDDEFERLDGKQLCNLFYFAFFPKQLGRMPPLDPAIRYTFNGSTWHFTGTGPEFEPPTRLKEELDTDALESIDMYVSHKHVAKEATVADEKDVVHIGSNSQTVVSLREVAVYNDSRFDLQASTSSFVADDVRMDHGFWLPCRIFYNFNRFVTESIYRKSTYPFLQYLIDFTGYLSLFTGASVFSVFLLPILYSMKARKRTRLRHENPDAYVLHKYKNRVGVSDAQFAVDRLAIPGYDDDEQVPVSLPGYNV